MFFVYFDRNECCCSAKIWSVVIKNKPVFVACVARIVHACEWIPSFFLLDCEMFKQAHIHTQDDGNKTKILLHSFTKCCKHCCLYTFPIIYIHIYIYTHSVHCTIVIADCGPVTLIGKRGVVHFFPLRRRLRFCSVLFFSYVVGEKKCFCASGSKLSCCRNSFFRTYTHPMWVWKKKVQSLLFDFSLCWYNGGELWKIKRKIFRPTRKRSVLCLCAVASHCDSRIARFNLCVFTRFLGHCLLLEGAPI